MKETTTHSDELQLVQFNYGSGIEPKKRGKFKGM